MNTAFMEGAHAANKGKSIKDNPYRDGLRYEGSANSIINKAKQKLLSVDFNKEICEA